MVSSAMPTSAIMERQVAFTRPSNIAFIDESAAGALVSAAMLLWS